MDRPRAWNQQGIDLSTEPKFRIGGAVIDPKSRDAVFAGGSERLQPQNLKVLIVLGRRSGQVVTRAELIDLCWDGRILGEDVINHAISVLRTFATRIGGFAIETVPKSGYRLIESRSRQAPQRRWSLVLGLSFAAVTVAFLLYFIPLQKSGKPPVPSVAILPFDVPPGDRAAAELARGARVSLSQMLSEGGFPVRLADAKDVDADFLISGDIAHDPGKFEAMVRMEETEHRSIILTHHFAVTEERAAGLADQIGASVAANLSWAAALMILDRRHSVDPAITSELLQQMSITVEGGDMRRAYQIARGTVEKAPNSAIAQIALAFDSGFVLGDLPREQRAAAVQVGRQAADRAIALAPKFGDTYVTWCFFHSSARLAECEDHIRQGMRIDPDAPFTTAFLSALLSRTGRIEDALAFARISIANDRFKPAKLGTLIRTLEAAGYTEEADSVYVRAVRWWPANPTIAWNRLQGLIERGNFAAVERITMTEPELGPAQEVISARRSGDLTAVRRACTPSGDAATEMLCLVTLADLGQNDAAYSLASRLYPSRVGRTGAEEERLWLDDPGGFPVAILSAPSAAALRRDARFVDLASRVGLTAYWKTRGPPDFCRRTPEPICSRLLG